MIINDKTKVTIDELKSLIKFMAHNGNGFKRN